MISRKAAKIAKTEASTFSARFAALREILSFPPPPDRLPVRRSREEYAGTEPSRVSPLWRAVRADVGAGAGRSRPGAHLPEVPAGVHDGRPTRPRNVRFGRCPAGPVVYATARPPAAQQPGQREPGLRDADVRSVPPCCAPAERCGTTAGDSATGNKPCLSKTTLPARTAASDANCPARMHARHSTVRDANERSPLGRPRPPKPAAQIPPRPFLTTTAPTRGGGPTGCASRAWLSSF